MDTAVAILLGLTSGAALALALSRRLMASAFFLFFVLLGVGLLFGWAGALFAAAAQVLVYVGGILVLIVFGLMLTQKQNTSGPDSDWSFPVMGAVAALGFSAFFLSWWRMLPGGLSQPAPAIDAPNRIGVQLLTTYLIPFELLSLLLLAALIGAIQIARPEK
jgi:NADH-quinone oxidoreductase subunit J